MNEEVYWHLALTQVPQIGDVHIGVLLGYFGNPSDVFKAKQEQVQLKNLMGLNALNKKLHFF
jgi:predicted Rossmann fold nucleotide-binding protein DprA/Smf involved in DNA uptake